MGNSTTGNFSAPINTGINEFKKTFLENFDLHFILILAIALILESVFAVFMSRKPVEEYSETEIERIQERFANFVLKQPEAIQTTQSDVDLTGTGSTASQAEASDEEEGLGEGGGEQTGDAQGRGEVTAETRQATRMAAAQARAESRANLSRQVSNKGLLGMLTGTGSSVEGNAVSSLFSGSGTNELAGNLDEVLSSAGGLKTQGQSGFGGSGNGDGFGNVKGSRTGGKASIDDLVSRSETTGSSSLSRKGDLVVEASTAVERGTKSTYRNYEAIQEVVNGHNSAIIYCYERELKRNPTLKGKVTVRFTVGPDGHVTNVSILNSTLNNDRVERCILSRIRLWKDFKPIDPSEGSASYRQTYVFGY